MSRERTDRGPVSLGTKAYEGGRRPSVMRLPRAEDGRGVRNPSRRKFLKLARNFTLGIAGLVIVGAVAKELTDAEATGEQREAALLLGEAIVANSPELLRNVLTVGDPTADNPRPAMRNKPAAPAYRGDTSAGEVVGRVELGIKIPYAITFPGRDAGNTMSGEKKDWLAFSRPDRELAPDAPIKPRDVVFAWAGYFSFIRT